MDEFYIPQLRIGNTTVGLVGMQQALASLATRNFATDEERIAFLLAEISRDNYIPPGKEMEYGRALLEKWTRDQGGGSNFQADSLVVRVLGKDCVSCNSLETMVREILARRGLLADLVKVSDPDEIGRYGVKGSPALIINDRVCIAGIMPTSSQVDGWISQAVYTAGDSPADRTGERK